MMDLTPALTEGTNNLIKWRTRYSAEEYPEKVVINIFYRRYTMMLLWPNLISSIETQFIPDFPSALQFLEYQYSTIAAQKVNPNLISWLTSDPQKVVGNIRRSDFDGLVNRVKLGFKPAREELEFDYLYYLLSDKAVLSWAAMCLTGERRLDAITKISDAIIEPIPLNDYNTLTVGLGQLLVSRFLTDRYNPLP